MCQHIRRGLAFIRRYGRQHIRHLRARIRLGRVQQKPPQIPRTHAGPHLRQIRSKLPLHRPRMAPGAAEFLDQHPPLPGRIQAMPLMQQPRHHGRRRHDRPDRPPQHDHRDPHYFFLGAFFLAAFFLAAAFLRVAERLAPTFLPDLLSAKPAS